MDCQRLVNMNRERTPRHGVLWLAAGVLAVILGQAALAAEWKEFRGNGGSSVSNLTSPPLEWDVASGKNLAWKVDLPGKGVSGPILVGDKVFVTASSGFEERRLHVLCFDEANGAKLWERRFWATGRPYCHPTSSNAACTPVADDQAVYAFYSCNDLVCLDLNGGLKWFRGLAHDYPKAGNDIGMSSSPVLAGGVVIVQVENLGDSFAAGLDRQTGVTRWKIPRPVGSVWSSPLVVRLASGQEVVILQSETTLTAVDPDTGVAAWTLDQACDNTTSPVHEEGMLYVPIQGMTAFKLSAGSQPEVRWQKGNIQPNGASVVAHSAKLYTINGGGVLSCFEAATGAEVWKLRLKGKFWATPAICGDHLFAVNQDGLAQVVSLAGKGKVVHEAEMGDEVLASPALGDGSLFLRGYKTLWKVAEVAGQPRK